MTKIQIYLIFFLFISTKSIAHSGKTDKDQCHKDHKDNTYHCHKPEVFIGNEYKVTDGDTITLEGRKIRFSGIDAPEINQKCSMKKKIIECGKNSKNLLINKISRNEVTCLLKGKDYPYNRDLGECFVNGESLSVYMVRNGYAFDYTKYSKNKYRDDEEFARLNKFGMWSMEFEYPWDYKKNK